MGDLLGIAVPVPNPIGPLISGVGSLVGGGARSVGDSLLTAVGQTIARGLADACKQVTDGLLRFLARSGGVDFRSGWWTSPRTHALLGSVATLAGVLMIGFVLLAVVQGIIAGDPAGMARAALVEVPVSVIGTVVLVAVAELLLGITDAASAAVLAGAPGDLGRFLSGFGSASTVATGGLAAGVMLVVFLVGAFLVWVELVVRSSLIYLLVAFAPLALAARVWPAAKGVFRRLCELGVALIVAKFGIALALGLGAAALAGGGTSPPAGAGAGSGADLAGLLGGATLMLLAAFMPFVVLRLLPVLETAVVAQGISRAPARAGQGGMQAAYYAQGLSRLAGGRGGGPGGSSGGTEAGAGPGGAGPSGGTGGGVVGGGAGGAAGGSSAAGAAAGSGGAAGGSTVAGAAAAGPVAAVAVPVGVAMTAARTARDRAAATAAAAAPAGSPDRGGVSG
ncbi:MAG TPA: hypothetical protein VFP54_12625 [Acidimicrobiales bacterium]|nr:hypothetical protein [Acidimicrobiales bacterium]